MCIVDFFFCWINVKFSLGVIVNGNLIFGKINMGSVMLINVLNYNFIIIGDVNFLEVIIDYFDLLVFWAKFVFVSGNMIDLVRIVVFLYDNFVFQDGVGGSFYVFFVFYMVVKVICNFGKINNIWVCFVILFDYFGFVISMQYFFLMFSINKILGGGSNNDYFYIDDVILVYNLVVQFDNVVIVELVFVDINVVVNDFDVDGILDNFFVMMIINLVNGIVVVNIFNGYIMYIFNSGFYGIDSFVYCIFNIDFLVVFDMVIVYVLVNG